LEGEWKFSGYFPKQCKALPSIHTDKIQFTFNQSGKNGMIFDTMATMDGEDCPDAAKNY